MSWLVREYQEHDLEAVVRLWDASTTHEPVFTLAEGIAALRAGEPAVVAVSGGEVLGAALAIVTGERAWLARISVRPGSEGARSALLPAVERLAVERGARRLGFVAAPEQEVVDCLEAEGFTIRPSLAFFEKVQAVGPGEAALLESLGGRILPSGLWDRISGMETEKTLIERRVVLPLAEPELAQAHGVMPPRAIVLFGPPGTGKTTFARGIASRLGWPFVEIFPSRLAADAGGLANALRDVFAQISEFERVLLFMDEVEEIAPQREGAPSSTVHGVTNELLKLIPAFRERDTRLLVAATNSVRSLDSAFLRPGRFDYLIPVGPPDATARRALWQRFVDISGRQDVDVDVLVAATDGFTPADIEYAARVAAQAAFERVAVQGRETTTPGASTDDYLAAQRQVRPTVTSAIKQSFIEDIAAYART